MNEVSLKPKLFKKGDVIIYAALAVVFAVLLSVGLSGKSGSGIEAFVGGEKVFEYDYDARTFVIFNGEIVKDLGDDTFIFYCEGGYNVLKVEPALCDAHVIRADCVTLDCTKMRVSVGGVICAPHALIIKERGSTFEPVAG